MLIKTEKHNAEATQFTHLRDSLPQKEQRLLDAVSERGASSWLTALPLAKYGLHLDKNSFRDVLCLRYGITLPRLPLNCVCGSTYTAMHAISCP